MCVVVCVVYVCVVCVWCMCVWCMSQLLYLSLNFSSGWCPFPPKHKVLTHGCNLWMALALNILSLPLSSWCRDFERRQKTQDCYLPSGVAQRSSIYHSSSVFLKPFSSLFPDTNFHFGFLHLSLDGTHFSAFSLKCLPLSLVGKVIVP